MSKSANKSSPFRDDDIKEEIVSINKQSQTRNSVEIAGTHKGDLTINYTNYNKSWFALNDKLDILHDVEWYRGTVKAQNGYALHIEFQVQNGIKSKWIKNCNEIFQIIRIICQCVKECKDKNHRIAAYGAQTNYSYDEPIHLYNAYTTNFNEIINNMLFKYIVYNIGDANNSADKFNQDFEITQKEILQCSSTSKLLCQYQQFTHKLNISFKKLSKRQQNATTNSMTLGHYIKYLKSAKQRKFRNSTNKQYDAMANVNNLIDENQKQINELIEQQNQLKIRKKDIINVLKELKATKITSNYEMKRLVEKQSECVGNIHKSTYILNRYYSQNKSTLNKLRVEKLKECEKEYKKWNKQDAISWIMMIDNQRFSSNRKYNKFRRMLNKSAITGQSLHDLKCDLFLKYVGLGIESRTVLIDNIGRVTKGCDDETE